MCDTKCIMAAMRMNHRAIIDLWPSFQLIVEDMGVPERRARGWKQRNSIPDDYWADLVNKARQRRLYVTPELLMNAAAERRAA